MSFDATVTVGDVLTMMGALCILFSVAIWVVGGKYFPTKTEAAELWKRVDQAMAATRTSVETAVGGMQNLLDEELARLRETEKERYERQCTDFARLERSLEGALADVREARDLSKAADTRSLNTEKTMDAGIHRIERALEGLANRPRASDHPRNGG